MHVVVGFSLHCGHCIHVWAYWSYNAHSPPTHTPLQLPPPKSPGGTPTLPPPPLCLPRLSAPPPPRPSSPSPSPPHSTRLVTNGVAVEYHRHPLLLPRLSLPILCPCANTERGNTCPALEAETLGPVPIPFHLRYWGAATFSFFCFFFCFFFTTVYRRYVELNHCPEILKKASYFRLQYSVRVAQLGVGIAGQLQVLHRTDEAQYYWWKQLSVVALAGSQVFMYAVRVHTAQVWVLATEGHYDATCILWWHKEWLSSVATTCMCHHHYM